MLGLGMKIIVVAVAIGAIAVGALFLSVVDNSASRAFEKHHKEVMEEFQEVKSRLSWIMGTAAENSHKLDILCNIATNTPLDVKQSR